MGLSPLKLRTNTSPSFLRLKSDARFRALRSVSYSLRSLPPFQATSKICVIISLRLGCLRWRFYTMEGKRERDLSDLFLCDSLPYGDALKYIPLLSPSA